MTGFGTIISLIICATGKELPGLVALTDAA